VEPGSIGLYFGHGLVTPLRAQSFWRNRSLFSSSAICFFQSSCMSLDGSNLSTIASGNAVAFSLRPSAQSQIVPSLKAITHATSKFSGVGGSQTPRPKGRRDTATGVLPSQYRAVRTCGSVIEQGPYNVGSSVGICMKFTCDTPVISVCCGLNASP
jgi:hypothetical protein